MAAHRNTARWAFAGAVGLITSSLIGAGILALPATLGLGGMLPSLLVMIVYGGLMLFSAEVLLREAAAHPGENYNLPDLYGAYLGRIGKWVAVAANLLVLYGLLTAYITGGAKVLGSLLGVRGSPPWLVLLLAVAPVALAAVRIAVIRRYAIHLMLAVLAAFLVMVCIGESRAEFARLGHVDWRYVPGAIPLVLTAFYFHNIIPVVAAGLEWRERRIRRAALCGILVAFGMCALWLQTGVCALPLDGPDSIREAYLAAEPATIPMDRILGSRVFVVAATVFAMMTVVTAFIGNGVALQSFLSGLMPRLPRPALLALALLPPVAVSVIWPDLFLKAVDVVGGIGIVVLFGVLPSLIAILKRGNTRRFRLLGGFFLLLALLALGIEVAKESGLSRMHPDAEVEYWKHNSHKLLEK